MATQEGFILDGLDLNTATGALMLEDLTIGLPGKRIDWMTSPDTDGAIRTRPGGSLRENREIAFRLRVQNQASMDLALAQLTTVSEKLEEAETRGEDGIPLVWTPADSTKSMTYYVLSGMVGDLPITVVGDTAGWFYAMPTVNVVLTCKPHGYGPEVATATVTATTPVVTILVPNVPGDAPAEGRLIVTDNAAKARRHVEWGLQQRYYDAATALLIDSDQMIMTGYAGANTTSAVGGYNPDGIGGSIVTAVLYPQLQAVCGLGDLTHIGVFRLKARVYNATTSPCFYRLAWRQGDGPMQFNAWAQPIVDNRWCEIDLGLLSVKETTLGTQRWTGQIEAYCTVAGQTVRIDWAAMIPVGEGYGKARADYVHVPGVLTGSDNFTGITTGVVLNARVAPLGGSWVTAGAATDYTGGVETITRSTVSDTAPRLAVIGATNIVNTEVGVRLQSTLLGRTSGGNTAIGAYLGVVARYTGTTNYVVAQLDPEPIDSLYLRIITVVAGASTTIAINTDTNLDNNVWYALRLIVYSTGGCVAQLLDVNGNVLRQAVGNSTALATGGALASGKPGIYDYQPFANAATRYYDDFYAATPAAEPIVVNANQSVEFRHDGVLREDAAGTVYGQPPSYRGGPCFIPPAGDQNRTARILVKARANDIDVDIDDAVPNFSTTVEVRYRPRYLTVPA